MLGLFLYSWILMFCGLLPGIIPAAHAEPPAQSVHWGSIAFPDHDQSLTLSTTVVDR